ncbi:MAG: hypothetical protein BWY64_01558 [bacterium ADurb.Bin363]|nr:MAG: hypothetical protein BWY64_01558 [bacterium ADurb.Bin363]
MLHMENMENRMDIIEKDVLLTLKKLEKFDKNVIDYPSP